MRVRILAVVIVLLLASSVGSVLLLRAALLQQLDEEVTVQLDREAEEFQLLSRGSDPRTGEPFDGDLSAIFDVYFSREIPDEGETLLAFVDGTLYESRRAQDAAGADQLFGPTLYWLSLEEEERGVIDTALGEARYVATPLEGPDQEGLFVVANFSVFERDEIQDALRAQVTITMITLTLASLVGAALAGRVLRPLVTLASTARTISDTDLTQRIPVSGRDEASLIAEAFNDMLTRLERVFAAQRQFLDDTSHELRTPLTVIRGHVELLELDETRAERRETVRLVTDEIDRLSRMVDDLFLLARSQQPDFVRLELLDVSDLLHQLHRKLAMLAPLEWQVEVPAGLMVAGDSQRLTQAVMQLVANATKHTPEGATITLSAEVRDAFVVLSVADDGRGVSREDAEQIFRRSSRGDAAGGTGAGLGLAIVLAIAEAHGGTARLAEDGTPGARFEILIPRDTPGSAIESGRFGAVRPRSGDYSAR